jgi:hypothetical protein
MIRINRTILLRVTLSALFLSGVGLINAQGNKIIFPRAFAFAIDDIGWNEGSDLGDDGGQGPYRAGVNKKMDIKDYQALINVAKSVGVRLQGLFVLCEMDRANICAKYPTTTMYGADWNNSKNVINEQIEIMNYVRDNAAYLEFGMHGVGHEYWPEKMHKVRAEWYNKFDKKPWPEEILRDHFKCFKEIMAQYGLTPENGQSFPESFVPCAYSFYWNPDGKYSLGELLNENGVKYANTLFSDIKELNPPTEANGGGFDHGVQVINRLNNGNLWYQLAQLPTVPLDSQKTDIIESHWPNWLAQDSFLQASVSEKWIAYYKMVQHNENRYLAKNTEQLYSQWLYKKYTTVEEKVPGNVVIDNSKMTDDAYKSKLLGNLVLKVKINPGQHITADLDNRAIPAYFEDAGYAFLYLPPLEKKRYVLKYTFENKATPSYVYNDGTYNVYGISPEKNMLTVDLKIYGTQVVKIKCKNAKEVTVDNPFIRINKKHYDPSTGFLNLEMSGRDFQGEKGKIKIQLL